MNVQSIKTAFKSGQISQTEYKVLVEKKAMELQVKLNKIQFPNLNSDSTLDRRVKRYQNELKVRSFK